jgi:hypothetical protein
MELPDSNTRPQNQSPRTTVEKKKRFKLVRLEERIAPGGPPTLGDTHYCTGSGIASCPPKS